MPQATAVEKLHSEVGELKREVRSLRSLLISVVGKDEEGAYRPRFVREVMKAARERPTRSFRDVRSFLRELKRA